MLSTELISLPTGFIFLCAMGTIWRGRLRFEVPMLFCLGWVFNFLIGGISGVFLSDVPSDVTTHGSFFSMAHFHYTIMGGLVFTLFAAIYYWGPKMTGFKFNERLAKWHFWTLFIFFNSTFAPLFAVGILGQPRRVVTYPSNLQGLNVWVSVSAFCIGISMLIFLFNLVWSQLVVRDPAEDNPWHSKSPEWQLPTPVPVHDFDVFPVFDADPYPYGVEPAGAPALAPAQEVRRRWKAQPQHPPIPASSSSRPSGSRARIWVGARQLCGAASFFFVSFVFAYFYLRSLDSNKSWKIGAVNPGIGLGVVIVWCCSQARWRSAPRPPTPR